MSAATYALAYRALVTKQIRRILRSWVQSILPSVITMALFLVIFGHFVGRHVQTIDGISYADYIVPGLIMMAVITNAYSNACSAFFGAKLQRHIEELLIAPVPGALIVLGYVTAGAFRGLLVGAIVAALAIPFTGIHLHDPIATLAVAILTAIAFALAGLINGILARDFDETSVVSTFVIMPLTYLGGVFYSVARLPEPWAQISLGNPMLYMVDGFRYGLLGVSDVPLAATFSLLAVLIVTLGWLCHVMIARGVAIKP
ncbi:MAG: ABC transporter permease [Halofilum sp. (in: g-proteobacteria)]